MARRDETASGITQRHRATKEVWMDDAGNWRDREGDLLSPVSGDGSVQGATASAINVSAPKVFTEGTTSQTDPGIRLYQPNGTNSYLGATAAYQEAAKNCTVTWSAGTLVTIEVPAGHGCVESDPFVLQGSAEAAWWRILRVASVTSSTILTARVPFLPTAAPTGTVTFRRCVRNVTIDLDLDYNFAGNAGSGSDPNRMALVLAFLADSTVRVRGRNVFKYVVLAAGCDNVTFDVGSFPNANSDTFKLYGPSNNNRINVYGQAAEDCASLQALEPAAFIGYMPCRGHISNTTIVPSARVTTAGSGAVVIYSDPTYSVSGTLIDGGECLALNGTAAGLAVAPGTGFSPTADNLPDVTIRGTRIAAVGNDSLSVRTPMRRLSLQRTVIERPNDITRRGIYINNPVDVIEISDQNFVLTEAGATSMIYSVAAVKTLILRSCSIKGLASSRFLLFDGASSSLNTLILDNCNIDTLDVLARFESAMATSPTVIIRGGRISAALTVTNYRKTGGTLILEGPTISGATNGVCRSEGAGVVTNVHGWANLATPSQLAVSVSGGKVNLRTPNMSFDHTASVLNNADGNEFVTTAAGGTLTAGMPVIGSGAAWLCRRDFTKTS